MILALSGIVNEVTPRKRHSFQKRKVTHLFHNSPDHLQNPEVYFVVQAARHYALIRCRRTLYTPPCSAKPTYTATQSPHFSFGRLIILFPSDLPTKISCAFRISSTPPIPAIHFKLLSFISLIISCGKSYKIQNSSHPTHFLILLFSTPSCSHSERSSFASTQTTGKLTVCRSVFPFYLFSTAIFIKP